MTNASAAAGEVRGGERADENGESEPEKQGLEGLCLEEEEGEEDERK